VGYRRILGHEYLQALRRAKPFSKSAIQAAVISHASDDGLSMHAVLGWEEKRRTQVYRDIIDSSPDVTFFPRFSLSNPTQEKYDALKEAADPTRAELRLDEREMEACSDYVVEFLIRSGFQEAFKEIVITGSVPQSMEDRAIPGFYSTIAGSIAFSAAIGYKGEPGRPGFQPFLFVNPLVMRRNETERRFILTHELLHYLIDHIHRLLLNDKEEDDLHRLLGWVPQELIDQINEMLSEALVEAILYDLHGTPRPLSFVLDLVGVQPELHQALTERIESIMPRDESDAVVGRFNAECLYDVVSSVSSHWIAGDPVPGIVSDVLEKLPQDYNRLYMKLADAIPEIVKDAFISASEFERIVVLTLQYPQVVQDIRLLRMDG